VGTPDRSAAGADPFLQRLPPPAAALPVAAAAAIAATAAIEPVCGRAGRYRLRWQYRPAPQQPLLRGDFRRCAAAALPPSPRHSLAAAPAAWLALVKPRMPSVCTQANHIAGEICEDKGSMPLRH
jgi:hypothetical protein